MNTTDEQAIARFQASGNPVELGPLVERYLEQVRNLAYRLVLCHAAADDIAQEVFLKVMRSSDSFRGDSSFSTWLYRVTVNAAREHLRKRTAIGPLPETELPSATARDSQPVGDAIRTEFLDSVEQALRGLSDKLRTAIVLTAVEGLPAKEAAAIEGCSTATMHWRIHAARKQLKQTLGRYITS